MQWDQCSQHHFPVHNYTQRLELLTDYYLHLGAQTDAPLLAADFHDCAKSKVHNRTPITGEESLRILIESESQNPLHKNTHQQWHTHTHLSQTLCTCVSQGSFQVLLSGVCDSLRKPGTSVNQRLCVCMSVRYIRACSLSVLERVQWFTSLMNVSIISVPITRLPAHLMSPLHVTTNKACFDRHCCCFFT